MKTRKIPQRKCVACQQHKDKKELIRIVKTPEGEIVIDDNYKKNGRGAYLCRDEKCISQAIDKRLLNKSLKVSIDEEFYQEIKDHVK